MGVGLWQPPSSNNGSGVQPKEGCAFQRRQSHVPTRPGSVGDQCSAPRPASFSKLPSHTGGQTPSERDSMSFGSRFRRIQRLSAYTLGYRYMKCSILNKWMCVDQLECRDDLCHLDTFEEP